MFEAPAQDQQQHTWFGSTEFMPHRFGDINTEDTAFELRPIHVVKCRSCILVDKVLYESKSAVCI